MLPSLLDLQLPAICMTHRFARLNLTVEPFKNSAVPKVGTAGGIQANRGSGNGEMGKRGLPRSTSALGMNSNESERPV